MNGGSPVDLVILQIPKRFKKLLDKAQWLNTAKAIPEYGTCVTF